MKRMIRALAKGRATLDLTRFPVAVLSERGTLSDPDRLAVTEALLALLDHRERHAVVMDLTAGTPLSSVQRTYVANLFRRRDQDMRAKWAGIGLVVQEPLLTYLPTAAFWMRISPVSARIFPTTNSIAAFEWAKRLLGDVHTGVMPILPSQPQQKRRA
jgi:hypothetical protein